MHECVAQRSNYIDKLSVLRIEARTQAHHDPWCGPCDVPASPRAALARHQRCAERLLRGPNDAQNGPAKPQRCAEQPGEASAMRRAQRAGRSTIQGDAQNDPCEAPATPRAALARPREAPATPSDAQCGPCEAPATPRAALRGPNEAPSGPCDVPSTPRAAPATFQARSRHQNDARATPSSHSSQASLANSI